MTDDGRGLGSRSTADLLILLVAATVCVAVLAAGGALAVVAIVQPGRDLSDVGGTLSHIVSVLVGLVAGFLAGRSRREPRDPD